MAEQLLERYLTDMGEVRRSRAGVPETSYYPALERLLTGLGSSLSPKVRCVINLAHRGAGLPDGGLFTADQFRRRPRGEPDADDPFLAQAPARGVIEAKPPGRDVLDIAESEQVERYWNRYGMVLVTNFRAFALIGRGPDGRPRALEGFTLAASEEEFWALTAHPRRAAAADGERMLEYLKRVLLHNAPLAAPQEVAAILASYAHDARLRIEQADLPALAGLRQALEQALGLRFEGDKGEHFFRSTLIQTLFYGVFSAWVLWARRRDAAPPTDDAFAHALREPAAPYTLGGAFDWKSAHWLLRVPMLRALFVQVADPARLGALGLIEVLDWTAAALNRVDRAAFFETFDEGHAVQYFYEPFLHAFDPALRKDLGVWYTPEEIVRYQVERVDAVLRSELGLADGLADPQVVVLDPCCGTGAYLRAVLRRIAATLHEKGGDALVAHDLKKAAMERVFGFEIMPAPFVIAHLQLGLELETLGAPLSDRSDPPERAGVYLTNALTGWEPPKEKPKQIAFPGFEDERDAAGRIKQEKPILVVLGNPPYNAFAGVSPEEENNLVEPYKHGLIADWGIRKFNLDDLYIRFFRLAEKRIAEHGGRGVVSFISNHSWVSDPSFVVMRRHLLDSFDRFWIENMHGNRKISEYAPDGRTSETVFATSGFSAGIQQGVVISLWVKLGQAAVGQAAVGQAAPPVVGQAASPVVGQAASPVVGQAASPVVGQAASPVVGQAASPGTEETGRRPVPRQAASPGAEKTGRRPVPRVIQPMDPHTRVDIARRHLPHWRQEGTTYFVTWRLADSIPGSRLVSWRAERELWLKANPKPWTAETAAEYRERFPDRLEAWLDQGMGECLLAAPNIRATVEESLLHFNGMRYDLRHYVIMPNHVHVLVSPRPGVELSGLLHTWKGYTAKVINRLLGRSGVLWQDESYDHIVRNEAEFLRILQYIEDNPEKAHLPPDRYSLMTMDQAAVGQAASPVVGQAASPGTEETGRRPVPRVLFRDDLHDAKAAERRAHLLSTLDTPDFNAAYETATPAKENRWSFRPSDASDSYLSWPKLTALCAEPPSNGLMEKRGGALIDDDRAVLETRMKRYFDKSIAFDELKAEKHPLVQDAARYDAKAARVKLLAIESFNPTRVYRYAKRPMDYGWCYFTPVRPIWNEPRPTLSAHCWEGNAFLLSRFNQAKNPEGVPFYFARGLSDDHLLAPDASAFPLQRRAAPKKHDLPGLEAESVFANLSPKARAYLEGLGFQSLDVDADEASNLWYHALAIGYAPAYLAENADGIRQDWPRIPLPSGREALADSAALGRRVAALLDTESPVPGVTAGKIREEWRTIGVFQRVDGRPARPEGGDLDVTAGWGHAGKNGVTMPGRGRLGGAGGPPASHDVFLNDVACWRNIPAAVWEFTIGGYQVIKKWLSYREKPLLGRGLTPDEVRYVTEMSRRLAALVALRPELDANYRAGAAASYAWPG
jgi:REP element-mobilizing transposase RayT